MPKIAKELTNLEVKKLSKIINSHPVGGVAGLYLVVGENSCSWKLRLVINIPSEGKKRRTDIGLGSYSDVSLHEAREKARDYRKQVKTNIDPVKQKRSQREEQLAQQKNHKTFRECAEMAVEIKAQELKNKKHIAQWRSTLETYAYPIIGDRIVGSLTKKDIKGVLESIWEKKKETANRLRARIEYIFDYAKGMDYFAGDNPASWKGVLQPLLGTKKRERTSFSSLPYEQVNEFMSKLLVRNEISAKALAFLILTAARSGEVRGAKWGEINIQDATWTIPKERMKAGKMHKVPLSRKALSILASMPNTDDNGYIFPTPRGGQFSDVAMTALIRRIHEKDIEMGRPGLIDPKMDKRITVHGFRSTFRVWAADKTEYSERVCENALAHTIRNKTEGSYNRTTLFDKRKLLMADWARYCELCELVPSE